MDGIQGRWQPSMGMGADGTSPRGVSGVTGAPASPPVRPLVPASHIAPPLGTVPSELRELGARVAATALPVARSATAQQVRQVAPPLLEKMP